MTHREHLIEQHILQYESHLKHIDDFRRDCLLNGLDDIDEMLRRAHEQVEAGSAPPEAEAELKELKGEREKLAEDLTEMKRKDAEELEREALRGAGPMGVWDAVAQRLEKLVEHLD